MINSSETYGSLKQDIKERIDEDKAILTRLREEIRPLKDEVRRIHPRSTTAVSMVATDGGNNKLEFDPFLVQVVRVVDSNNNEYCMEVITPTSDIKALSQRQFERQTALGDMMIYLGVKDLSELSPMIPNLAKSKDRNRPISPTWVQVYRELIEWAVLFKVVRTKDFATDTLIVFDGFLRSKVFSGNLFAKYLRGLDEGLERQSRQQRKLYLVGVAKHSKVLARYRLAMALEHLMDCEYACYLEIPRELEANVYRWSEYARGADTKEEGTDGEEVKYVGGKMFFVKFGDRPRDPIWPIDIYIPQSDKSSTILGCLLADAINGFPVPLYPQSLQKAHENAAIVGFDFDIMQDQIFDALRETLGEEKGILDVFRLQDADPAALRYE